MSRDLVKEMATEDFIDDLRAFSEESMRWCSDQSAKATESVSSILNVLLDDSKRIAKMSETTLAAIKAMRAKVVAAAGAGKTTALIENLKALCNEHTEVSEFINPVIETLQFQDRITQNMNNVTRMMATWASRRTELRASGSESWHEKDRVAFGLELLECCTMAEERKMIREIIKELPVEEEAEGLQLF